MKVLVTGATGFLGGRVAHALASAGHGVRALVRAPARWGSPPEGAEAVVGDVTDAPSLARAAEGCAVVVHAAALVKVWVKDRAEFDRVNVGGFRNALAAARGAGAKLVYVSSFLALGPTDGAVFDEETPRRPGGAHNDYERTKWAADLEARASGDAVRLYPGVIFGPGALTAGNHAVHNLVLHARGKLPGMLGKGDRKLCFAFVEDVARGVVSAVERAAPGAGYVLGGENRTLAELFSAFARETGIPPPRIRIPYAVGAFVGRLQRAGADLFGIEPELTEREVAIYRHEWAYASDRAVRDLAYRITPFEEAVARTVSWMKGEGLLP